MVYDCRHLCVCYLLDLGLDYELSFFFSSRRRHTRCALVTGVQTCALPIFALQRLELVGYDDVQTLAVQAAQLRHAVGCGAELVAAMDEVDMGDRKSVV